MILNMYTDVIINELRSNTNINKQNYINGIKFVKDFIINYDASLFPLNIEVEYPILDDSLSLTNNEKKQWEIDFENSVKLHKDFISKYNIPLSILSDERFIVYLTHDIYFDYMTKRWPLSKNTDTRIKEKYFLPSGSQAFTRNTFLRFFWYPLITYDKEASNKYHLTKLAFEYADPVNQIMERRFSRNPKIVLAALKAIEKNKNAKYLNSSRRTFFGKAINNILGMLCLDALNPDELLDLFDKEIDKIVNVETEDDFVEQEE